MRLIGFATFTALLIGPAGCVLPAKPVPKLDVPQTAAAAPPELAVTTRADYPKLIGKQIEVSGVVTNMKCPTVQGIDMWELAKYRGQRVKVRGILCETVVTREQLDSAAREGMASANRGPGKFYHLENSEFEVLP